MDLKVNSGISFGTEFIFRNEKAFSKMLRGRFIDYRPPESGIQRANEFYTVNIRTCSAGGLFDTKNGIFLGFHLLDYIDNMENIQAIIADMFSRVKNPDKAFLLGGKTLSGNYAPYAMQMFNELKDAFTQRIENLTVLEEHKYPWSETDFHYNAATDRLDICSMYRRNQNEEEKYILSKEELYDCFKSVTISPDDKLIFK